METILVLTLNGISFGMLLFILSAGLSLLFGLMRVINLAHGSFYLVGAYVGLSVIHQVGNFLLAALAAGALLVVIGAVTERVFLRRIYRQEMAQVLLTFGFLFIFSDVALTIWGGQPKSVPEPSLLSGPLTLAGITFPKYRLFLIGVGLAIGAALWYIIEKTRVGAVVRAGVDDDQMTQGLGINIPLVFTITFALGAGLAGLSGVIGGPIVGPQPGADFNVLLLAFVVVIVGGLGSIRGAFVGSLLVGLIDNFAKSYMPDFALVSIFLPMVVILAVRPNGLFGRAT